MAENTTLVFVELEAKVDLLFREFRDAENNLKTFVFSHGHGHTGYPNVLENRRLIDVANDAYLDFRIHRSLLQIIKTLQDEQGGPADPGKITEKLDAEIQSNLQLGNKRTTEIYKTWRERFLKG